MGFPRPSLGELVTRAIADISGRTQGSAFIKRSAERVIAAVQAALANGVHGHLEWNVRQALPTTADIEALLGWGTWLKVPRKGVVKAVGTVLFDESTSGTLIPVFRQLQTPDGVLFETTANATVTGDGIWTAPIQAVVPGSAGNFEADTPVSLVSPIAGSNSIGKIVLRTSGGEDIEAVEDYRPRVIDGLRQPPAGGGPGDYEAWALEVPGVTRAYEFGNLMGYGTVSLAFVMDNRLEIIPTAADIAEVQAHIDSKRPLDMRALYVQPPIKVPVHINLSVTPNTQAVRDAVLAELKFLFLREPTVSKAMSRSKVDEAISTAAGEDDHNITAISSLNPGLFGLLTLGTVTFQ